MHFHHDNIVLIGMPGAGKTTIGALLASRTGRQWVDTDHLIEQAAQCPLQALVDCHGQQALLSLEEEVLLHLDLHGHVIATGGSAVYSAPAMQHLQTLGPIVFLEIGLAALEARIPDYSNRGLAKRPGQSFADLFAERQGLYQRYADIVVSAAEGGPEAVCDRLLEAIQKFKRD